MSFSHSGRCCQVVERDFAALVEVGEKSAGDSRGDGLVADREIDLVVVLEGSIVDVGRADHCPQVVDEQCLDMGHAAAVLENSHAALEQPAVHPAAGQTHPPLVGVRARHDHDDLDAAPRGADERAAEGLVRQEIRRGRSAPAASTTRPASETARGRPSPDPPASS